MNALQPLVFDDTVFTVMDRDGQPWLRGPEIAVALGYERADAIARIHKRNADEFTQEMTDTVNLTVSGNLQSSTRIFSLRGAYLLGMFASTPPAKRFRRWVLDVLEGKAQAQPARAAQAAPQQGDLFGRSAPQQLFEEVALLRQLHATQQRLVELLEAQLKAKKRNRPQPLTVDEIKLARGLKEQGASQASIARHMGRSQATISLILRDLH